MRTNKIGFSGTREGMSNYQKVWLRGILEGLIQNKPSAELHMGDCIGADVEAAKIAEDLGYYIVIHPACDTRTRAFYEPKGDYLLYVASPALMRNKRIVDCTQLLIAAPRGNFEQRRSGTWHAIRYAMKTGTPTIILSRGKGP
jgi:hypothetical protein